MMIPPLEAIERLREGNRRFVADLPSDPTRTSQARCRELVDRQDPFAVVLGCSDSRVPTEIIFDHGLGELFVIRVAGNIVAPSLIGSVEFAVQQFDARLVVVLGHSGCGAVTATLAELERPHEEQSPNLNSIVERIRPSVSGLLETDLRHDPAALLQHAVRANIRASVDQLRCGSEILERSVKQDGLLVIGAEYELSTGVVEFFDGPVEPNPIGSSGARSLGS